MRYRWSLPFTRRDAHQRRKDFALARRMVRRARLVNTINDRAEFIGDRFVDVFFARSPLQIFMSRKRG